MSETKQLLQIFTSFADETLQVSTKLVLWVEWLQSCAHVYLDLLFLHLTSGGFCKHAVLWRIV